MKPIIYILSIFLLFNTSAFSQQTVNLQGIITNVPEDKNVFFLLGNGGYSLRAIANIPTVRTNEGNITFNVNVTDFNRGVYFLAFDSDHIKPFLVENDSIISFSGDWNDYANTSVQSPLNNAYYEALNIYANIYQSLNPYYNQYRMLLRMGQNADQITQQIFELESSKLAIRDSLKKFPLAFDLLNLQCFLTYAANPMNYANETDYVANEFFKNIEFNEKKYSNVIEIKENFKNYAHIIGSSSYNATTQTQFLDNQLSTLGEGMVYRTALAGIIQGLALAKNANLFMKYADLYTSKFKDDPNTNAEIEKIKSQLSIYLTGVPAPEIIENTPLGQPLALSSLKGKVVLLDFWASWCGPCRQYNPELVAIYKKYKDKGFEIFAVSLDKSAEKWKEAIKTDQLEWLHVSDLKGWASAPAQKYQVTSIPTAILLDKEGKIIARDLKGIYLEKALDELLK